MMLYFQLIFGLGITISPCRNMSEPMAMRDMPSTPPRSRCLGVRSDAHGREVQGLLAGAAEAIDGGPRHVHGEARDERHVASHVHALLVELGHTAHDHVVDRAGIDAGALDDLTEVRGEFVCATPASAPLRRPTGFGWHR